MIMVNKRKKSSCSNHYLHNFWDHGWMHYIQIGIQVKVSKLITQASLEGIISDLFLIDSGKYLYNFNLFYNRLNKLDKKSSNK